MKWLKSCFSGCFYLILIIVIASFVLPFLVGDFLSGIEIEFLDPENTFEANEEIYPDEIIVEELGAEGTEVEVEVLDSDCRISDASYRRAWQDLSVGRKLTLQLKIEGSKKCQAEENRNRFYPKNWSSDGDYWRQVYVSLIDFDNPRMKSVMRQFETLKKEKKLNYPDFAEAVVTFIQNIPYVLVLTKPASEAVADGDFYKQYLEVEKRPYIENIKYGLHSPIEFLHTRKGDCDTRTVLAYSILTHFGYDVAIVNNPEHSMLGINLPAQGTYLTYQGKKYFIWETTATNWALGSISPEYRNNLFICVPSINAL